MGEWKPIKLTDKVTGRIVYISIIEREMYLHGIWSFEDLWYMNQPTDEHEQPDGCGAVMQP